MDPLKVSEKIANEIVKHFQLPHTVCFSFIKKMVSWAYVAGWEEGTQHTSKRRPVVQMDQHGNVIKIYRSIKDASRTVGTHRSSIENVCKGKKNSCKGFHWRYVESPKQIKKIVEGWQKKL